ncbi:TPA: hypothetical protein DD712_04215, partial [Candidatus Acetothermia bacterium]|nr:hypothetical protein [Candidatus Acetothermia bacterium]
GRRSCFATDRCHVLRVLSAAVDSARRQEVKEQAILKKTRYLWLTNQKNLELKTVRAYHIRENFQLCYEIAYLRSWFWRATHSRIEAVREAAWVTIHMKYRRANFYLHISSTLPQNAS